MDENARLRAALADMVALFSADNVLLKGTHLNSTLKLARIALTPASEAPKDGEGGEFQGRVKPWMLACFGEEVSNDKLERGDRLLEEVLELLQSGEYPQERVAALTAYVWSRAVGEPAQEVGGVMVTLAAYCLAHGLDMHEAAETELARIWTKVEKIRAKQAAKPKGSALPQAWPATPSPGADFKAGMLRAAEIALRHDFSIMAISGADMRARQIAREIRAEAEKITSSDAGGAHGCAVQTSQPGEVPASASPAPLTLRAGKRYRDGHGEVKGPLHRIHWENGERMLSDGVQVWLPDGTFAGGTREDKRSLVAEVGDAG